MNKQHWILPNPQGKHTKVGIMHGVDTGNLMIYCNQDVIKVDFKVFDDKSYKFFVDEEFCEIQVKRKRDGSYRYEFKFDRKVDTEHNKKYHKRQRKWSIQSTVFIIGITTILIVGGLVFWQFRGSYLDWQLNKYGVEDWATVYVNPIGETGNYYYKYTFMGTATKYGSKRSFFKERPTTPEGIPLYSGYQFRVKYAPNYVMNNRIDLSDPKEETILKMMKEVGQRHLQLNQGRVFTELECEVQTAYDIAGIAGLADILHQDKSETENPTHNTNSFLRLKRDTPFAKAYQKCISPLEE